MVAVTDAALRVACSPGLARIAVFENGTLKDFGLWIPGKPDLLGAVFRGRVGKLAPTLGGAFIALPGFGSDGFLSLKEHHPPLCEGEAITVRVTRAPMGNKGPRLSLAREMPAASPGLLKPGPSALEEMAQRWTGDILIDTPTFAARVPSRLRERVRIVPQTWDEDIADAVDALSVPDVSLPGGMAATITPTPALVAIDMDSGTAANASLPKQTAQFALNRDALPAIVRQIVLRNLSGAILIDPAGLSTRKRQALRDCVDKALEADPLRARCLGITALGLIEIVRARTHAPLHEELASPHGRALAALREVAAHCAGQSGLRPVLKAGTTLARALEEDPLAVNDVTVWCEHPLTIISDPSLPPLSWNLVEGRSARD
ncbi:ribonuclease E/G [Acetobacter estunensis]|uniref:ribonuclease E/G n=1 Tax=Acetobacter estunensis TaxID=104097 RepID=UPI001C2CE12E|nr:ribonuclease E/G [Acetobacter estunensis]MBV1836670.1 ribonuclease E/G [Acetobacter estunensis]